MPFGFKINGLEVIMNKKLAWNEFMKSGSIKDYLEFCKYKNMEDANSGKEFESEWNNNSRK